MDKMQINTPDISDDQMLAGMISLSQKLKDMSAGLSQEDRGILGQVVTSAASHLGTLEGRKEGLSLAFAKPMSVHVNTSVAREIVALSDDLK